MGKKDLSCCSTDEKWRVESDLRTLCEAEEIRKDPKKMEAVRALANERMIEMAAFAVKDEK